MIHFDGPGTWECSKTIHFDDLGTWKYEKRSISVTWKPENTESSTERKSDNIDVGDADVQVVTTIEDFLKGSKNF